MRLILLAAVASIVACGGERPAAEAPETDAPDLLALPPLDAGAPPDSGAAVRHGLSANDILGVVREHEHALRECYESQHDPKIHGTLVVTWAVEPAGTVASARIMRSDLDSAPIEDCVLHEILSARFPASESRTHVQAFPFKLGVDPASVHGPLPPDQINRVIFAHARVIRSCYDTEASKDPSLRGTITVGWSIDPTGSVAQASVASSTMRNPTVEGCILQEIRNLRFPTSDQRTEVPGFPFKFGVAQ